MLHRDDVALTDRGLEADLKSELIAGLSHRFRVPLDVIIGYTELLLDGQFGD